MSLTDDDSLVVITGEDGIKMSLLMITLYYSFREELLGQLKDWKISTEHYRKELTKLIEEKNYYESDSQKVF